MTDTAAWYPPLEIDEADGFCVKETLSDYDNVFEPLGRADIIRAIADISETFNCIAVTKSAKEEDQLLVRSMKILEPISLIMLEEIFGRSREHSKYFPEEWMLKKERDIVVGRHIAIYQRLAILAGVTEQPSLDDTITRDWFFSVKSRARHKYGKNYLALIRWESPDNGSSPGGNAHG